MAAGQSAENEILGRFASAVAMLIRGKCKTNFTPHVDCGDNVIVINAEKIKLTGSKMTDKEYVRYTGYPGGQRFSTPKELLAKKPTEVIHKAVKGMLPKNRLGAQMIEKPAHLCREPNIQIQLSNQKKLK